MRHTLARQQINDNWRFRFEADGWQQVTLPHTWNALDTMDTDPEKHYRRGTGIYELDFIPPDDITGRMCWLEFEAVSQRAKVYFDNALITEHHGGYTAFTACIPNRPGTLRVEANNTPDPDLIPSDRSDFFLYGGITRNVWLYQSGHSWIDKLFVDYDLEDGQAVIRLSGDLAGEASNEVLLHVMLSLQNSAVILQGTYPATGHFTQILPPIANPKRWSPDFPTLYDLTVELRTPNGNLLDCVSQRIGFRAAAFPSGGPFMLNGERVLLRGTHRHEDWAGYGSGVSDAITRQELAMIKAAGFNFIRLGHYPQSRAALDACDELGLIVWEELPWCRGGLGGESFKQHTRAMLHEMIDQHYNHACVLFWGLGNELDWESDHPDSTDDKVCDFLAELHATTHKRDPKRWTALRRFDFGADVIDAYSPSIWAGWYRGRYEDYEQNITDAMQRFPRLLHAEWGGDSHVGRHNDGPHIHTTVESTQDNAEEVGTATSDEGFARYSKDGDWSESYIIDLMDWHLRVQKRVPDFAGALQWAFKDFGTPLRPENPVPYVNQKGLLDRSGTPKDNYYLFQAHQTATPVVRIEGHHWPLRPAEVSHRVRVISNCRTVELQVDGTSLGVKSNDAQMPLGGLVWDVTLTPGEHELQAVGDGETVDTLACEAAIMGNRVADFRVTSDPDQHGVNVIVQLMDAQGQPVQHDERRVHFQTRDAHALFTHQGVMGGSSVVETANGRASIRVHPQTTGQLQVSVEGLAPRIITLASDGVRTHV